MPVSPVLKERWRSKQHVGPAAPSLRVTVTRGVFDRTYQPFEFISGGTERFMTIVNGKNSEPWQGFWRATGEPIELPNVLSVVWDQALKEKGARSAVIQVENVAYRAIAGEGGLFHQIARGFLSPTLGAKLIGRVAAIGVAINEWYEVMDNGYKIDVYEGYGDQMTRTFCGLIDTTELETHPDRITISARSPWMLFTDQRLMGQNKAPEIIAPVTFADREKTRGVRPVGSSPAASSTAAGRSVQDIVKPQNKRNWVSDGSEGGGAVEWVEINIPNGYYENIYLNLPYKGQAIYISIHAGAGTNFNGEAVEGWVAGKGEIGGVGFVNKWGSSSATAQRRSLGGPLEARGCKIRVSFTKLPYRSEWGDHRAGCTRLAAFEFGTDAKHPLNGEPGQNANKWVLVDDLADIAKTVFMWAGYHEWEVEELGWSLVFPMSWTMDKFLIDIIDDILKQGNWVCYEESPSPNSESIGVPCFVHNRALDPPPAKGMLEITDRDMLETMQPKFDLSNLPWVIYYRGKVDTKGGKPFQEELVKRVRGTYFPPWSGAGPEESESGRTSGVRRHDMTVDENLTTQEQCKFAAMMAAQQYALESATVQFQIPGYPGIELNQQVSVKSDVTGINSRVWVAQLHSEHTTGKKGSWNMTVSGALLDTIDMQKINKDLLAQQAIVGAEKLLKEAA